MRCTQSLEDQAIVLLVVRKSVTMTAHLGTPSAGAVFTGEGSASLCLERGCGEGSAMDCSMSCTPRGWVAPYQTGSLQWQLRVTGAGMAGNDSGIGSGWQQSKQN